MFITDHRNPTKNSRVKVKKSLTPLPTHIINMGISTHFNPVTPIFSKFKNIFFRIYLDRTFSYLSATKCDVKLQINKEIKEICENPFDTAVFQG